LIGLDGSQMGVLGIDEVRRIADQQSLDILLVSDTSNPPVCKLVNYGQFLYKQKKKEKQAKKIGSSNKGIKSKPQNFSARLSNTPK